jgi:hypothetical protein
MPKVIETIADAALVPLGDQPVYVKNGAEVQANVRRTPQYGDAVIATPGIRSRRRPIAYGGFMRRSTQLIRWTLPIALSIPVTWLVPLSAKQTVAPRRQDTVTSGPWTVRSTDHFDIYYQPEQESRLNDVAREAEHAYLHISGDLKHGMAKKVPLIVVHTNRDLPQNSSEALAFIRASGAPDGVDHMFLSIESFSVRVAHELTHIFELDMIPCQVPPWVMEGLADHEMESWIPSERSTVHASAVAGAIPPGANLAAGDRMWGHALFDFVATEYGTQGLRRFVMAQCGAQASEAEAARVASGLTSNDFNRAFIRYVSTQFSDR